jgi:hypothetical protein
MIIDFLKVHKVRKSNNTNVLMQNFLPGKIAFFYKSEFSFSRKSQAVNSIIIKILLLYSSLLTGDWQPMKDMITLVSGIEFRTREMVSRLGISEQEIVALKARNNKLLNEIEELKLSVKQLEYKNKIIKIAKALEGKQETTNAKLKINELLREVDRCIGLLND